MKQIIGLDKIQAKRLGEIMEYLADKGLQSITRDEAVGFCIDAIYEKLIKK